MSQAKGKEKYPADDTTRLKAAGGKPEVRKKRPVKEAVKLCLKCKTSPPLANFYKNNGWASQMYHDAWCKSCIEKFCTSKDSLREYCWWNNRVFNEAHWERSMEGARYQLASNQNYLKSKDTQKTVMEESLAVSAYTARMNLANNYQYSDNISPEQGYYAPYNANPASSDLAASSAPVEGDSKPPEIDTEIIYDEEWNGLFSRREIRYLNNYYSSLEKEFALDDVSMRDYARKVAKASLNYDDMYNKYRSGGSGVTARDLAAAKNGFDELSKSANFAACKRKSEDKAMVLPLGLVVEYLEANKKIYARKDMWEKDSIDQMLVEQYHLAASLGLDRAGGVTGSDPDAEN